MSIQEVAFDSQGITLRGRLYQPDGAPVPQPAVIMAHGLSATIDGMVAERYAEAFHAAGLTVLLYDHPHFGRSDGEPRCRISIWRQARGYVDALSYISSRAGVDPGRIALWGDSLSAGEAIIVTAIERRVAALVCQVPSCGRTAPPVDVDAGSYLTSVRELLAANLNSADYTPAREMPVVSADQLNAPSLLQPLTAFRWFVEYGGRFQTNWENRAMRAEPAGAPPSYPVIAAGAVQVPTLFVIAANDEMPGSRPDIALMAYERLQGPRELVETDGGHFGLLYHPGPIFDRASQSEASFLARHLTAPVHEASATT